MNKSMECTIEKHNNRRAMRQPTKERFSKRATTKKSQSGLLKSNQYQLSIVLYKVKGNHVTSLPNKMYGVQTL